jgi:TRAP-type mannitol/chloroaromatic compound transport system permease large subunit
MITLEMMPPLMFGGLFCHADRLPGGFTLAALGLSFGPVDLSRLLRHELPQAVPRPRSLATCCQLDCCSRFPSSPSWARSSCGLAEDMLDSMGQLFRSIRRPGYSVIIVGFILSAITGGGGAGHRPWLISCP